MRFWSFILSVLHVQLLLKVSVFYHYMIREVVSLSTSQSANKLLTSLIGSSDGAGLIALQ